MGDAATGVISIDNLLVIGEYFKIWPEELFVVDVEPGPEQAGEELSPEVGAQVPEILKAIRSLAVQGKVMNRKMISLNGVQIFI